MSNAHNQKPTISSALKSKVGDILKSILLYVFERQGNLSNVIAFRSQKQLDDFTDILTGCINEHLSDTYQAMEYCHMAEEVSLVPTQKFSHQTDDLPSSPDANFNLYSNVGGYRVFAHNSLITAHYSPFDSKDNLVPEESFAQCVLVNFHSSLLDRHKIQLEQLKDHECNPRNKSPDSYACKSFAIIIEKFFPLIHKINQLEDIYLAKEYAIDIVSVNGLFLKYLDSFQDDEDVVSFAVTSNPHAIRFASQRIKDSYEIHYGAFWGIEYTYSPLLNKEIDMFDRFTCTNRDGILQDAKNGFWGALSINNGKYSSDKEIAIETIAQYPVTFTQLDQVLQQDRGFVKCALSLNGMILLFVDDDFANDDELVALAIKSNPLAADLASQRLQDLANKCFDNSIGNNALCAISSNNNIAQSFEDFMISDDLATSVCDDFIV